MLSRAVAHQLSQSLKLFYNESNRILGDSDQQLPRSEQHYKIATAAAWSRTLDVRPQYGDTATTTNIVDNLRQIVASSMISIVGPHAYRVTYSPRPSPNWMLARGDDDDDSIDMHMLLDLRLPHRQSSKTSSLQAVRFSHPLPSESFVTTSTTSSEPPLTLTGRLVYDSDTEQSTLQCTAANRQSLRNPSNFDVPLTPNVVANDFCFSAALDQIIVAVASPVRPMTTLASNVRTGPCRAYLDASSSRMQAQQVLVQGFSKSHALCVEPADAHTYWFGHMDGSLTLWDDRSNQVAMSTASDSGGSASLGNVLSVTTLSNGQVLARFACGSESSSAAASKRVFTRLYDARQSQQAIQEYALPVSANVHTRCTQACNGVATDPSHAIVLSPYVSSSSTSGVEVDYSLNNPVMAVEPRIGIWSLLTGDFMGSQSLLPVELADNERLAAARRFATVELCSTRTEAWEWDNNLAHKDNVPMYRRQQGRFGLWFKLAQLYDTSYGPVELTSSSNVHHITLSGRFDL
jgi:hypothetical protein